MKNQVFNPYLPGYEYIPDGEPYEFDSRVYVYGSHDRFHAPIFCVNDYVCWSAPVEDLSDWRYEGVIYRKNQDPKNKLGLRLLFAPDVTKGTDGRYYLYYAFDAMGIMGVAVCDTPAGQYEFYGYVHHADGIIWGRKREDAFPFDPGVLVDDDGSVYLYSGYFTRVPCFATGFKRLAYEGGYVLELKSDMLTIKTPQKLLFPKKGTGSYLNHEFFEASSIRKYDGKYYFVYSSSCNHELCYAVSDKPTEGFEYGGVLVSNGDVGLPYRDKGNRQKNWENENQTNKKDATNNSKYIDKQSNQKVEEENPLNYIGNNHGGMLVLNHQYYIFYHRHTDRTSYSRQTCAERLERNPDGSFSQAEMTSCGLNKGPLLGLGRYESRIACNLWSKDGAGRVDIPFSRFHYRSHPYFTQNKKDGDSSAVQYIANMRDGAVAGFKYFVFESHTKPGTRKINLEVSGHGKGKMLVSIEPSFETIVAEIPIEVKGKRIIKKEVSMMIPDGRQALYFQYKGRGSIDFYAFELL